MYTISVTTAPSTEPVAVNDLKTYLRLNTTDEDTLLSTFISTARQQFEFHAQRPVLSTVLRQSVSKLSTKGTYPSIYLMRAGVTAVSSVYYYDADDALQTSSTHSTDIINAPSSVYWLSAPSLSGVLPIVAYVNFTAGWANANAVPSDIKTAIMLLAAHYYEQRAAYVTENLNELPQGFCAICSKYALGVSGSWDM